MKKTMFSFILMITSIGSTAQSSLSGIIYYQNSGGKSAHGVQVSAFGGGASYTTDNGMFYLSFNTKKPGDKVKLVISNSDGSGKSIEVVNTRQLELLRLPNNSNDDPIEIIVCFAGQRDESALRFYGIIEKATLNKFNSTLNKLENRLNQADSNQDNIATLLAEIDGLKSDRDQALDKIEEQALFIASINKDQASEMVNSAIRKIEEEADINGALIILNDEKFEEAYQLASDNKMKAEKEIKQVIEGYELKIKLVLTNFQYNDAIRYYEKIIDIHKTHSFGKEELAEWYSLLAIVYFDDGKYQKAMENHQMARGIREKILEPYHLKLAVTYNNIAVTHQVLGGYQQSLEFLEKSHKIKSELFDSTHNEIARSYNNFANTYRYLGEFEKALFYQWKSINISVKNLDPKHLDLATSYDNLGLSYQYLGNYEEALKYQKKSLAIFEETFKVNNPELATSYNNIAGTYQYLGEYKKMLQYDQRTIAILEATLNPLHPHLATAYSNIGFTYEILGKFKISFDYQKKAMDIRVLIFDAKHPQVALSYDNLGVAYRNLGNYESALKYQLYAMDVFEEILAPDNPRKSFVYGNLAQTYFKMDRFKKALAYQKKAIKILELALPENHPKLVEAKENLEVYQTASKEK